MDNRISKNVQIPDNIINIITKAMENSKVELAAGLQTFDEVKTKRGFLQGNSISQQLLAKSMIIINYILRKCIESDELTKS